MLNRRTSLSQRVIGSLYGCYGWAVFGLCALLALIVVLIVPGQTRRHRVIDVAHPTEPVFGDPHLGMTIDIGERNREWMQKAALGRPGISHLGSDSTMVTPKRHVVGPLVVLALKIPQVLEVP